jgi:hypothetical protein
VVGWVRLGEKVKTTSRTIRGRGMAKALREVRAWLRQAIEEGGGRALRAGPAAASRGARRSRAKPKQRTARRGAGRKRGS